MSIRKSISAAVRKSVAIKSDKRLSYYQRNQNFLFGGLSSSIWEAKSELNEIFQEAKKESSLGYNPPYQSVIHLSYYIRRNRNNIEETIKSFNSFLEKNSDLSEKIIINITDTILNLITENSQIIYFINSIFPTLFDRFYSISSNISLVEDINNITGKLIKIGVIYSRQVIENQIDQLFKKLSNENDLRNEKKILIILLICKIIQSSSLFAFNKLTEKKIFKH
jgi:hypothetical protein